MAYYRPQSELRQVPITDPKRAALLFIDVQNYNCSRDGAIYKAAEGKHDVSQFAGSIGKGQGIAQCSEFRNIAE